MILNYIIFLLNVAVSGQGQNADLPCYGAWRHRIQFNLTQTRPKFSQWHGEGRYCMGIRLILSKHKGQSQVTTGYNNEKSHFSSVTHVLD